MSPFNSGGNSRRRLLGAATSAMEILESRRLLSGTVVSSPFHGVPFTPGQLIQAEDFDLGGEGVAYHDTTPGNAGGSYRPSESVDIEAGGTGLVVGSTIKGEWLNYTVSIPSSSTYTVEARIAIQSAGAGIHFSFDGSISSPTVVLPNTKAWDQWQTITSAPMNLSAGIHVLHVSLDNNANTLKSTGNYDWFEVSPTDGPSSFNWTQGVQSPARRFEGYGRVVNGKLYAFGGYTSITPFGVGNTVDGFNPTTNKWTHLGTMPAAETHSGVAVDDSTGDIYFVGGLRGNYPGVATSDVYRYETTTNRWTQLPSLPFAMAAGNAQIVNGVLHYFGGIESSSRDIDYSNHYEISLSDLNSGTGQWTTAAPIPTPRDHFTSAVVNGKIYLMGGEIGHDALHEQQSETDVYDPTTDSWTRLADMPVPKSHDESGTFIVNGKIVLAGGQVDDFQSTNNISEYDPATNQWYILAPLPNTLAGTIAQKIGSKFYVISGYDGRSGIATMQTFVGNWAGTTTPPPSNPPPPPPVIKPPPPPVPISTSPSPFKSPFTVGQTIQAEDFDNGGEGVAYHDNDSVNHGGSSYRAGTGVDIEHGGTGLDVGYIGAGEWLTYTLDIAQAGNYRIQSSVSNTMAGGAFHVEFAGVNKTGSIAVPKTAGWNSYQTVTSQSFSLTAGTIVMRVYMDKAAANMAVGNFDWLKLISA